MHESSLHKSSNVCYGFLFLVVKFFNFISSSHTLKIHRIICMRQNYLYFSSHHLNHIFFHSLPPLYQLLRRHCFVMTWHTHHLLGSIWVYTNAPSFGIQLYIIILVDNYLNNIALRTRSIYVIIKLVQVIK
jgi:hypothetical protein